MSAEQLKQQTPDKERKPQKVEPIFEREGDLKAVVEWFNLPEQVNLASVEKVLNTLFTPVQLKRLAVLLSEQSRGGELNETTEDFFGKGETEAWDPEVITLEGAVEAKLARMLETPSENPQAVKVYLNALSEVIAEDPKAAAAFFAHAKELHQAYIDAENASSFGVVSARFSELRAFIQSKLLSAFSFSMLRGYLEPEAKSPLSQPRPKGVDYLFSYELHELAGKLKGLAIKLRLASTPQEKVDRQRNLKDALKDHIRNIIKGHYNY